MVREDAHRQKSLVSK
jgi:hypothetical protein